jgi:serine/threonine protein kinase/WD40 repeat protein
MADDSPTEAQRLAPHTPPTTPTTPDTIVPDKPSVRVTTGPFPRVPGYEIIGELGKGGMGVVYEALQRSLNRPVALKMIRAAVGATVADVSRFLAEAEVIAAIRHPNVVQVFECGMCDGYPYMALELFPHGTLGRLLLEQGTLAPRVAAELVADIAAGVQAAHDAGIVHRDLKPANILLQKAEAGGLKDSKKPGENTASKSDSAAIPRPPSFMPKVTDFGIARRGGGNMTATGVALGTPQYMAPEQAIGRSQFIGPSADVYAMGVILFECLTGRTPFEGPDPWSVLQQVISTPVPSIRKLSGEQTRNKLAATKDSGSATHTTVPRDLELICYKCLEKEPHHRYSSAAELAEDLRRFLDGKPVVARPLGPVSRVWRTVWRNPVVASLIFAVVLSSTIGALISLAKAGEAQRNADAANEAAAHATSEEVRTKNAMNALQLEVEARKREEEARKREEEARKQADAFALRTVRMALYSRELGDASRALAAGEVGAAEQGLAACEADLRGWEWRLLNRWLTRRAGILPVVKADFNPRTLAVSRDGRWVAAGGLDWHYLSPPRAGSNSVWLWDLKTGGPPVHFAGNFIQTIRSIAFDPEARRLAAVSADCLRVWDLTQPTKPRFEVCRTPDMQYFGLRLTADSVQTVFCALKQGKPSALMTWPLDAEASEPTEEKLPGEEPVWNAAIAPDGKSVLLSGPQLTGPKLPGQTRSTLRRVSTDGKLLGGPVTFDGEATVIAFALDGKGAFLGVGNTLVAWDGIEAKLGRRSAFAGQVQTIEVRRDGRVLAAGMAPDDPMNFRVWDPETGATEAVAHFGQFSGFASFPDGRIAVGDYFAGTRVWNPVSLPDRTEPPPFAYPSVAISGDRVLFSGVQTNQIWVRLAKDEPIPSRDEPVPALWNWASPSRRGIGRDSTNDAPTETHTPEPNASGYITAAWYGDQIALVVLAAEREKPPTLLLYDPARKAVSQRYSLPAGTFAYVLATDHAHNRVAFAVHQTVPGTTRQQTTVMVWDTAVGKPQQTLPILTETPTAVVKIAFSPDGKRLAVARMPAFVTVNPRVEQDRPGTVMVWNLESGALAWEETIPRGANTLAFSPDGTLLAVGGNDSKIQVRAAADGKAARAFSIPIGGRTNVGTRTIAGGNVTFSPDGSRLAMARPDSVTIWDVSTGQPVLTLPGGQPGSSHQVAFSRDGRRLIHEAVGKVSVYDAGPP